MGWYRIHGNRCFINLFPALGKPRRKEKLIETIDRSTFDFANWGILFVFVQHTPHTYTAYTHTESYGYFGQTIVVPHRNHDDGVEQKKYLPNSRDSIFFPERLLNNKPTTRTHFRMY